MTNTPSSQEPVVDAPPQARLGGDLVQVGMSETASTQLTEITEELSLTNRLVGYRLGLAMALAMNLEPTDAGLTRTTAYSATGTLDPDGQFRAAVLAVRADHGGRPYALMERLAEAGLARVAEHLVGGRPLGDLLEGMVANGSESLGK